LEYLRLLAVDSLAFVILTHPHEDHYLGMAELLRAYQGKVRLVDESLNDIASALWLEVGQIRVILGSDLDIGRTERVGWRGVMSNPDCPDLSAVIVKVAHHGSKSAHVDSAWQLQGSNGLLAVLTPWKGGANMLPKASDIRRLKRVSRQVGQTTTVKTQRPETLYNREVAKALRLATRRWRVIPPVIQVGAIRVRFRLDGSVVEQIALLPAFWN
jgi:hypothetical protein